MRGTIAVTAVWLVIIGGLIAAVITANVTADELIPTWTQVQQ